jgi:hypothetical protein
MIDFIIRWRTWLANVIGAVLLALPDLLLFLNSSELMAILPTGYQKWLALGLLVINIWMRPYPAVRAGDLQ